MGSAIMPFIVMLALVKTRLFSWVLFGTGVAAYLLAYAPHRLNSLSFMFDFMLGAWLASRKWRFFVGKSLTKFFGSAFVLIFFRSICFTLHDGQIVPHHFKYDDPLPMLVEGIAAFLLIGVLASEHGRIRFLRSSCAISLGNLSYSLYLIHFPVAILIAKLLSTIFSDRTSSITAATVLMASSLAVSLGLAFSIYRFVELPSIAFGKRAANRLTLRGAPLKV